MQFGKPLERAVKGTLQFRRKTAGGKFQCFQVILQAVATKTLAYAWLIRAGTAFYILFAFAFHIYKQILILYHLHHDSAVAGTVKFTEKERLPGTKREPSFINRHGFAHADDGGFYMGSGVSF